MMKTEMKERARGDWWAMQAMQAMLVMSERMSDHITILLDFFLNLLSAIKIYCITVLMIFLRLIKSINELFCLQPVRTW